jgi:hypothetical protein
MERENRMLVTADQAAALRAQLAGQLDEHRRLLAALDPAAFEGGYQALVASAFCLAVNLRFPQGVTTADAIDFVGKVRSVSDQIADRIDPRTAERIILRVRTDEEIADIPRRASLEHQILLLTAFLAELDLDDARLDEFLAQSREFANRWLS